MSVSRLSAAMVGIAMLGGAQQAHAITLSPNGAENLISLNKNYTYEVDLDIGDWSGVGPDLFFAIKAAEDLTGVTTVSVNPSGFAPGVLGGISNLALAWNSAADGSGASFGSLSVTDVGGNLILSALGGLSLVFSANQVAYLLVSADAVLLNNTNVDLRLAAVPLPPALLLFGSGLAGLAILARRRKRTESAPV